MQLDKKAYEQYQAIYVHIPFCRQKCLYCDFASYAGFGADAMAAYTDALCNEIAARQGEADKVSANATVYFGGGTPSVLPTACIAQIANALKKYNFWQQPLEATIEVNPGTVDLAKLQALKALGFDRISFGVQSLNNKELRAIGRIHNEQQALEAVALAKTAGFARISCDLIYGLPLQTLGSLQNTLLRLTDTGIEHISVYGLILEEGTPLAALVEAGKISLPEENATEDMYELVQSVLKKQGFERYEISNYAKNKQFSSHNTVYWRYEPYLGFGAAACGFDGSCRRTAVSGVREYIDAAANLQAANWQRSSLYNIEALSKNIQLEEFMFMGLRQACGVNLAEAEERFAVDVWQKFARDLQPFIEKDLVIYETQQQRLRLTEQGMAVGNQVFEIFVTE